jgi:hypothetical protein
VFFQQPFRTKALIIPLSQSFDAMNDFIKKNHGSIRRKMKKLRLLVFSQRRKTSNLIINRFP